MDGEGSMGESFQPCFIPWQGQKEFVNGWVTCSMNKANLGVPWNLSTFCHPHMLKELRMDLCLDRQNPWGEYMWLKSKESSQKGTDNSASLMSRHLLPALGQALSQNHLFVKLTQTHMDDSAPLLHLLGHLMASVIA